MTGRIASILNGLLPVSPTGRLVLVAVLVATFSGAGVAAYRIAAESGLENRSYVPAIMFGAPQAQHTIMLFWSPHSVGSARAYRTILDEAKDLVNGGKLSVALIQFVEPKTMDMELSRLFQCVPAHNYRPMVSEYLWAYGNVHHASTRWENALVTNDLFKTLGPRFGAPENLLECAYGDGAAKRVQYTIGLSKALHEKAGIATTPTVVIDGEIFEGPHLEAFPKALVALRETIARGEGPDASDPDGRKAALGSAVMSVLDSFVEP